MSKRSASLSVAQLKNDTGSAVSFNRGEAMLPSVQKVQVSSSADRALRALVVVAKCCPETHFALIDTYSVLQSYFQDSVLRLRVRRLMPQLQTAAATAAVEDPFSQPTTLFLYLKPTRADVALLDDLKQRAQTARMRDEWARHSPASSLEAVTLAAAADRGLSGYALDRFKSHARYLADLFDAASSRLGGRLSSFFFSTMPSQLQYKPMFVPFYTAVPPPLPRNTVLMLMWLPSDSQWQDVRADRSLSPTAIKTKWKELSNFAFPSEWIANSWQGAWTAAQHLLHPKQFAHDYSDEDTDSEASQAAVYASTTTSTPASTAVSAASSSSVGSCVLLPLENWDLNISWMSRSAAAFLGTRTVSTHVMCIGWDAGRTLAVTPAWIE